MKLLQSIFVILSFSSSLFAGQFKSALPLNSTIQVKENLNISFAAGWNIVTFRPNNSSNGVSIPVNPLFRVSDRVSFCNLNDIGLGDKSSPRSVQSGRKFKVAKIEESDGQTDLSNPSNPIKATYYFTEVAPNGEEVSAPISITCHASLSCKKSVIRSYSKNPNYYYNSCFAESFGEGEIQAILGQGLEIKFAVVPSI